MLSLTRRFSEYLVGKKIIPQAWTIPVPSEGKASTSPLPREITPNEVFEYVDSTKNITLKLLALLGYFGSLRPGETFALKRSDFFTGDQAIQLSKTQSKLRKYGIGSRMIVHINKQLRKGKTVGKPKTTASINYVAIWDSEAAKRIAKIVKEADEDLFTMARDSLFRLWKNVGTPKLGVTLHDLRRASGLYLGRTIELSLTVLQDHMRHTKLTTTELYMRRPVVNLMKQVNQDFDDVG